MQFNWGTGITVVYVIFALSMIGAVIASKNENPVLVDKDYYNLDINYQEHLDKKQNTAQLPVLPHVLFNAEQNAVLLDFPEDMSVTSGTAKFYRSQTNDDDFTIQLAPTPDHKVAVPAEKLHHGRWHIELDWEAGGKKYFYETIFER